MDGWMARRKTTLGMRAQFRAAGMMPRREGLVASIS
jgi:hypothetical protein